MDKESFLVSIISKYSGVNLIESEDYYNMLTAISMADATAVNGFWGKRIISGAAAMKELKNR